MSHHIDQPQPTRSARLAPAAVAARRGAALLMVLSVVAAASILSWAMLASASMRSQIDVNAVDSLDASYLAESGVSYGLFYLRYPSRSPVPLTTGPYDTHYGGESNLRLWNDARGLVTVTVTNTATNCFTVRASATVAGTRRVVEADARLVTKGYSINSAAGFNGSSFTMPNAMTITGPVISKGTINNQGSRINNDPTPIVPAGVDVVPTLVQARLLEEVKTTYSGGLLTDRTYTFDGQTYAAELLPSTFTGTLATARPSLNPKNVWYTNTSVVLTNVSLTGTLVVGRDATLSLVGPNNVFTAASGMPALVVGRQIELRQGLLTAGRLKVNGAAWVSDRIYASGTTRNDGSVTIDGALLMGGDMPSISLLGSSPTTVNYLASTTSSVDNLSTVRTVNGVTVLAWRSVE